MKLTVLGSGSAVSGAERVTSGYLIESGQSKLVLDLGFGCFKNLQKICNPLDISAICFSHFSHPGHVADLIALLMCRKVSALRKMSVPNQLNLFGPAGFSGFFKNLMAAFPFFVPLPFPVKVTEIGYDKLQIFNFAVRAKPMKHLDGNAIGFRIESEGKAIMYSGDSEYCDALVELAKEADLAVLECSSAKPKPDGHLNPEECAKIAKLANAKMLMLTHFYPETEQTNTEEIAKLFSGKIIKAKDLLEVEI